MVTVGHNESEEIIQAVQNIEQMSVQSEVEIGNLLDITSQIRLPLCILLLITCSEVSLYDEGVARP